MGDRGNIIVKEGESKVFLYTHWSGSDLPETIKSALKRGQDRWRDGQYLARILFCEMIGGDVSSTTGFGISSVICDGGTDILVNVDDQTVCEADGSNPVPFKKFIGTDEAEAA